MTWVWILMGAVVAVLVVQAIRVDRKMVWESSKSEALRRLMDKSNDEHTASQSPVTPAPPALRTEPETPPRNPETPERELPGS